MADFLPIFGAKFLFSTSTSWVSHHLTLQGLPDLSLRINELNSPAKIIIIIIIIIKIKMTYDSCTHRFGKSFSHTYRELMKKKKVKFQRYYPVPIHQLSTDLFYKTHREGPLQRMRPINWLRSSAFKRSGTQRVEVISTKPKSRGSWQV